MRPSEEGAAAAVVGVGSSGPQSHVEKRGRTKGGEGQAVSHIRIWTPGDARIWWACPVCKTEGGISPPVDMDELYKRVSLFRDEHAECERKAKGGMAWRGYEL